MGLSLAYRLTEAGHRVSVFEQSAQLGGLTTHHDFGRFTWDRFYHVILPSDQYLMKFLGDIGLAESLRWRTTRTGFYVDNAFHSLSTNLEFLRFPLLSLVDKARLAWTLLYGSRIDDWRRLEDISCEEWLTRVSGRATFEKMWQPLLLAKLGPSYRRVSAVFIWSYIKRMFSARDATAQKEQLGHVSGGYRTVFERLTQRIEQQGGIVNVGATVDAITAHGSGGLNVLYDNNRSEHFDKVVCTSPVGILEKLAPTLVDVTPGDGPVEYLGVVCMVLVTREALTPYYVLNIADEDIPFTGIIGMSNVVDTNETAGYHVTYLPKYVLSDDPVLSLPDAEIEKTFKEGIERMYPHFDWSTIESVHINRAVRVQPLQVMGYSKRVPKTTTRHNDFFVLNTAQFVNNTLNNNEVIRAVDAFCDEQKTALTDAVTTPNANAA